MIFSFSLLNVIIYTVAIQRFWLCCVTASDCGKYFTEKQKKDGEHPKGIE